MWIVETPPSSEEFFVRDAYDCRQEITMHKFSKLSAFLLDSEHTFHLDSENYANLQGMAPRESLSLSKC